MSLAGKVDTIDVDLGVEILLVYIKKKDYTIPCLFDKKAHALVCAVHTKAADVITSLFLMYV